MTIHLQREMGRLRKRILAEAAMVEESIDKAIRAVIDGNAELAHEVIAGDNVIDEAEIEIEEECLKILALHNPVAVDLRFIVTALKMNNDLERMGDIAVSIARRAIYLSKRGIKLAMADEFRLMADAVRSMVKQSLDALVNGDAELAIETCRQDDAVDEWKRRIAGALRDEMERNPEMVRPLIKMLDLTRHLERVADLATNIAEDVVYLVRGQIVRHQLGGPAEDEV